MPTLCGLQLAKRQARATGTLPCRCSKRPSRCSAKRGDREEVFALSELGYIALRRNDAERAERLCAEALLLARSLGDDRASAALSILSDIARTRGEHDQALSYAEEALARRRALGDPMTILDSTYHVGVAAFAAGDIDRSEEAFEGALERATASGDALHSRGPVHARDRRAF